MYQDLNKPAVNTKSNNNEALSALSMLQYNLDIIMLVRHDMIDDLIELFTTKDDSAWAGGKGKAYLRAYLREKIAKDDSYFKAHPRKAKLPNKRWEAFCVNCVAYSVLTMLVCRIPIELVHPDQFEALISDTSCNDRPSLIEDIECV